MANLRIKGITIIELMVTMMVLALIAFASRPYYKRYLIKSKFTEVMSYITEYKDAAVTAYLENDKFPSSFYGLVTGYNVMDHQRLKLIYYFPNSTGSQAVIQFYTQDLGIPGFVVTGNSSDTGSAYGRITLMLVANNNGMRIYCGEWGIGATLDVPLSYLPKDCQDSNLSSVFS